MLNYPHYYVSRTALQNALGISWSTLERWIRKYGCPVEEGGKQGEAWRFHLPEVVFFAKDPHRRLLPLKHRISVPCQECGKWVNDVPVFRNPEGILCAPCKEGRRRWIHGENEDDEL